MPKRVGLFAMRLFLSYVLMFVLFSPSIGVADGGSQCRPNKCGPDGWLGTLVPDEIASCRFARACNVHDSCYTRCAECGDLYNTKFCRTPKDGREPHRKGCDVAFYTNMVRDNPQTLCRLAAGAYYLAVRNLGKKFYRRRSELRDRKLIQASFLAQFERLKASANASSIVGPNLAEDIMGTWE